ncbi:MAG: MlaD family protein [Solirubrobacteraceae bacterium]
MPLGRTAIAIQAVLALMIAGFLLTRFAVSLPVLNPTYQLNAAVPDAAGLDPSHRPQVVIAGVPAGRVTGVRYAVATGRAILTLQLADWTRGHLFRDATVTIVPRSALQDLVLDIAPGTPGAGRLKPGATIIAGPQATPVTYDRVLGALDSDTRAYAQILIGTLRQVLRDRPGPLRAALDRLPALDDPVTRLAEELAGRRQQLSQLIAELDTITTATGQRGRELADAIRVARATLQVTAARQRELGQTFVALPSTLARIHSSLDAVSSLATPLIPALTELRGTATALPSALDATRRQLPALKDLIDALRPVVTADRAPLHSLTDTLAQLAPAARSITPALPVLKHLVSTINGSRSDILALLDNWPGAISMAGNTGIETRTLVIGVERLVPALFGIDNAAQSAQLVHALGVLRARRPALLTPVPGAAGGPVLEQAARAMLIATCRQNMWACVAAMQLDQPQRTAR